MNKNNKSLIKGMAMTSSLKNMMTANVSDPVGYVGIIAEKNGSLEHIVVLLDKPVCSLTSEEEELVYDCCGKVWPEIAAIRAQEITPVYDDNGTILNGDEWQKAPRLGIFPAAAPADTLGVSAMQEEV